ncbi:hypothetical protein GCM10010170_008440 [Dactylosporangium salmoneum]|uniref:Uncharacterized protein n=1 Tax=Dactylosporangium salmoneum TaxID=53361 RepID=A0ABN3FHY3_9ACTN
MYPSGNPLGLGEALRLGDALGDDGRDDVENVVLGVPGSPKSGAGLMSDGPGDGAVRVGASAGCRQAPSRHPRPTIASMVAALRIRPS